MKDKNETSSFSIELFETMALALSFLTILFFFGFRIVVVSGSSMDATLKDGDRVIVQSSFFTLNLKDIVVVDSYTKFGKPIVKRVIAKDGDEVFIDAVTGDLYINKILMQEPYIQKNTNTIGDFEYPLIVPQGMLFVMGDNRQNSLDSRFNDIGFIDERDILGKVLLRIYPFSDVAMVK